MRTMGNSGRIMVIDDDQAIRWMLHRYLSRHGFNVVTVADGAQMRSKLAEVACDLVILDLSLPGENGLSLARYLRENHGLGIIILTAAGDVADRVVGLEMGADDYMTKPFEPRELLARVKSVMRRVATPRGNATTLPPRSGTVRFGRHSLDLEAHKLTDADGAEVPITSMEYDLLRVFAKNPGKVLSRGRLLDMAHTRDWAPFERSIDIRVARLRRKLEPNPKRPRVIKTVRGAGYMFVGDR